MIIQRQLNYERKNDLSYNRSQVFYVSLPIKFNLLYGNQGKRSIVELFKNELVKESAIKQVSIASHSIVNVMALPNENISWNGKDKKYIPLLGRMDVDANFQKIFNLPLENGRWFRQEEPSNQHEFVLNETAVKEFKLHQPYLGQEIIFQGDTGNLIGITKDFHFQSMHDRINPLIFYDDAYGSSTVYIEAQPGKAGEAVRRSKTVWNQVVPHFPFEFTFINAEVDSLYKNDSNVSTLIILFSLVSIFTSLLGLLGLTTMMVTEKAKEIGIRKVLGASALSICAMISREFVLLVCLALTMASPLTYIVMTKWMQEFAYHIGSEWLLYAFAGIGTILLVLILVSSITVRNTRANPVISLRNE